jgi:hypothetical protein
LVLPYSFSQNQKSRPDVTAPTSIGPTAGSNKDPAVFLFNKEIVMPEVDDPGKDILLSRDNLRSLTVALAGCLSFSPDDGSSAIGLWVLVQQSAEVVREEESIPDEARQGNMNLMWATFLGITLAAWSSELKGRPELMRQTKSVMRISDAVMQAVKAIAKPATRALALVAARKLGLYEVCADIDTWVPDADGKRSPPPAYYELSRKYGRKK